MVPDDFRERIVEQANVARRELAEIDYEGGVETVLNAHVAAIAALIEMVDTLATEVARLRHQLEHPAR